MGIFDIFEEKGYWEETLVRDLIVMASIDGCVDKNELIVISKMAVNLGVVEDKLEKIIAKPDKVKVTYPTNDTDRILYMKYLLTVSLADGVIDANEENLLYAIGSKMNVGDKFVQKIISDAKAKMRQEYSDSGNSIALDENTRGILQGVLSRISSHRVALQFVLEELDAARQGNESAKKFAISSGFNANEYKNAMHNSFEEVDGANGPQQFLLMSCMSLGDMELAANMRMQVVDNVMKEWKLGKYS